MTRLRPIAAMTFGLLAILSCGDHAPEEVWVLDPESEVSLEVSLKSASGATMEVGRWIDLRAERSTGRWVRVRFDDLEPGVQWLRRPPTEHEIDVQSNVRWFVEPDGAAEFNVPTPEDLLARRVRFNAPGTYRLWAQSHTWGGGTVRSNPITVTIHP